MLDCSVRAFCVERYAGLQCACVLCGELCWTAVRSVWRGMLDCSVRAFCVERYAGLQCACVL